MMHLSSDDEGNVYVGVDDEVVCDAGDDDDVVHNEGGLDNVEGGILFTIVARLKPRLKLKESLAPPRPVKVVQGPVPTGAALPKEPCMKTLLLKSAQGGLALNLLSSVYSLGSSRLFPSALTHYT